MQVTTKTLGQGRLTVQITLYQPATIADFHQDVTRPLAIILPGGGFTFHSQREQEPIALAYAAQGFAAVVVHYRLIDQGAVLPTALWQIGLVVQHFRHHAAAYHISPEHLVLAGFSAGGYLGALYAGLWMTDDIAYQVGCPTAELRVNALALAYSVIGLRFGWPDDPRLVQAVVGDWPTHEADQVVTAQNPPTFIWATQTDELVPVENTLTYLRALNRAGVSVRATIYDHGPHGLSLAQDQTAFPKRFRPDNPTFGAAFSQPDIASWFNDELAWLNRRWQLEDFWRNQ
ncbi:alpha/beta hydrolase [Levilactobacillus zymae]|uniref:alpha/beta hydrolase n=1 Tax=Levilactobacillus zymae TaxID=267363 RepID=UPI0028BA08FE|nr:alpha/beta hydrolase [Levilactobacillus zymae]MDT6979383.1 alpha/beta hydrolase [Levilactobacillus zymae]